MRVRTVFFSWICVALAAAPAAAAEAAGDPVRDFVYRTLNLLLLVAILFYFARRPVGEYFADRRARIQDEIRQASELRREAEQRHAKWQRRLADLEGEIASIRERARERAERERQRMLADAHATTQRLRSEANAAIERELRRAVDLLRNEASDLALELAAEILRDKVSAADQSRLLDEFIHRIESSDAAGDRG